MDRDFLEKLEVGDLVGLDTRYHGKCLLEIKRTTKTLLIVENGDRYRREDGYAVGGRDAWSTNSIVEVTEDFKKEYMIEKYKKNIEYAVSNNVLKELDLEDLKTIYKIIKTVKED